MIADFLHVRPSGLTDCLGWLCNTKGRTLRKDVEPQTYNLIYQTNFFVSVPSNLCPFQTTACTSSNINFVKLACQPLSTALCRHASCPIQHPGGQALIILMHPSVLSEEPVPKHKSCSCLKLILLWALANEDQVMHFKIKDQRFS